MPFEVAIYVIDSIVSSGYKGCSNNWRLITAIVGPSIWYGTVQKLPIGKAGKNRIAVGIVCPFGNDVLVALVCCRDTVKSITGYHSTKM
jgi:hypothetical protein